MRMSLLLFNDYLNDGSMRFGTVTSSCRCRQRYKPLANWLHGWRAEMPLVYRSPFAKRFRNSQNQFDETSNIAALVPLRTIRIERRLCRPSGGRNRRGWISLWAPVENRDPHSVNTSRLLWSDLANCKQAYYGIFPLIRTRIMWHGIRFYNNLQICGDCQNTRKSHKTSVAVGCTQIEVSPMWPNALGRLT